MNKNQNNVTLSDNAYFNYLLSNIEPGDLAQENASQEENEYYDARCEQEHLSDEYMQFVQELFSIY